MKCNDQAELREKALQLVRTGKFDRSQIAKRLGVSEQHLQDTLANAIHSSTTEEERKRAEQAARSAEEIRHTQAWQRNVAWVLECAKKWPKDVPDEQLALQISKRVTWVELTAEESKRMARLIKEENLKQKDIRRAKALLNKFGYLIDR